MTEFEELKKNLKLIRGARVEQQLSDQLDEEVTFQRLQGNTMTFQPKTKKRQHNVSRIRIKTMELIPASESQQLIARAHIAGETDTYQSKIMFNDVEYHEEDLPTNVSFNASSGEEMNITPINLNTSNVKVNCTCLDFYWRFAHYNHKNQALDGQPPDPYQKKTDRPPVNPNKTPALCKHLLALIKELKRTRLVR